MNKLTKEGRMRYERDLKTKSDFDGGIAYAVEKAVIEGREKGQKEGREKAVIEIANKMKKAGFPLSQIQQFTKLSVEQINQI